MKNFELNIHYTFHNKKLLREALTHSSCCNENGNSFNNERLEFLGDSVLSIIVSDHLFHKFPDQPEGQLSKLRSTLVCTQSLSSFARSIDLGMYMHLGKGEEISGGRDRDSILENAFEAVIGAIYLDGGLEKAREFVLRFIPNDLNIEKTQILSDFKTALQEIIQQNPEEKLRYMLVSESGPDHQKEFEVDVCLNSNVIGSGRGKSKKQAEQYAAKQALELMGYATEA